MTDEQIEKERTEYADAVIRSFGNNGIPCGIRDIRGMIADGFRDGANFTLSHQWVSVEERLPEAYTDVLIATDKGQIRVSHLKVARSVTWTWPGSFIPKVIAWMPIPAIPQLNPEKLSI